MKSNFYFFLAMETDSQVSSNICFSLFCKDLLYEFCWATSWYDDGRIRWNTSKLIWIKLANKHQMIWKERPKKIDQQS